MTEACDPREHCITCGDDGVPMRILELTPDGAICVEDDGTRHQSIAVDFVGPVGPGDRVLVHAGVAIA